MQCIVGEGRAVQERYSKLERSVNKYTHSLSGVQYCSILSCNSGAALVLRIKNKRRAIRLASSFQPASTCGVS